MHYLILNIDLDSNPKRLLPHMRITDNSHNNCANADSNYITKMRMRMLRIESAFSPILRISYTWDLIIKKKKEKKSRGSWARI
jgi:hypothetical protein